MLRRHSHCAAGFKPLHQPDQKQPAPPKRRAALSERPANQPRRPAPAKPAADTGALEAEVTRLRQVERELLQRTAAAAEIEGQLQEVIEQLNERHLRKIEQFSKFLAETHKKSPGRCPSCQEFKQEAAMATDAAAAVAHEAASQAQQQIHEHGERAEALQARVRALEGENAELVQAAERDSARIRLVEMEVQEHREAEDMWRTANAKLRAANPRRVPSGKADSAAVAQLTKQRDSLQVQVEQMQRLLHDVEAKREAEKSNMEAAIRGQLAQALSEKTELEADSGMLRASVETAQAELAVLRSEHEKTLTELAQKSAALQAAEETAKGAVAAGELIQAQQARTDEERECAVAKANQAEALLAESRAEIASIKAELGPPDEIAGTLAVVQKASATQSWVRSVQQQMGVPILQGAALTVEDIAPADPERVNVLATVVSDMVKRMKSLEEEAEYATRRADSLQQELELKNRDHQTLLDQHNQTKQDKEKVEADKAHLRDCVKRSSEAKVIVALGSFERLWVQMRDVGLLKEHGETHLSAQPNNVSDGAWHWQAWGAMESTLHKLLQSVVDRLISDCGAQSPFLFDLQSLLEQVAADARRLQKHTERWEADAQKEMESNQEQLAVCQAAKQTSEAREQDAKAEIDRLMAVTETMLQAQQTETTRLKELHERDKRNVERELTEQVENAQTNAHEIAQEAMTRERQLRKDLGEAKLILEPFQSNVVELLGILDPEAEVVPEGVLAALDRVKKIATVTRTTLAESQSEASRMGKHIGSLEGHRQSLEQQLFEAKADGMTKAELINEMRLQLDEAQEAAAIAMELPKPQTCDTQSSPLRISFVATDSPSASSPPIIGVRKGRSSPSSSPFTPATPARMSATKYSRWVVGGVPVSGQKKTGEAKREVPAGGDQSSDHDSNKFGVSRLKQWGLKQLGVNALDLSTCDLSSATSTVQSCK